MRPHSEIRVCLASALVEGKGTTKQLAMRTGWSISMTRLALDNMVRAGDACKPESIRVKGVKRPVPVYARAVRQADTAAANDNPFVSLISAWAGGFAA